VTRVICGGGAERAEQVMMTAHMKGVCVIAVFTREIAERKAKDAIDEGRAAGHPLMLSTEPED
jgi:ATP-dependent Clp protease adaptor protein ClpS